MKILVLGSSGLLGFTLTETLYQNGYDVYGTSRSSNNFPKCSFAQKLVIVEDLLDKAELKKLIHRIEPNCVINCLSLENINTLDKNLYEIYSELPKTLHNICRNVNARTIQISTDAVFSGLKGNYSEFDTPDPIDDYGKAKLLGELSHQDSLTIRTSMIGHNYFSSRGLLEWFLNQSECTLYPNAIFSGLTVNELSKIISKEILPRDEMHGIYHLSSNPISKFELLSLVKKIYKLDTKLNIDDSVAINRSLCSNKFREYTGYQIPLWGELIQSMKNERVN